jgi:hypothetical protein
MSRERDMISRGRVGDRKRGEVKRGREYDSVPTASQ